MTQPPYPTYPVQARYAPPPPVRRTNGLAIASFVLGLLGFGLLPVIFGHVALGQIRRDGDGGAGFAIAGLVLGYLVLASVVVAVVIVALAVGGGLTIAGISGGFS
ncbi:DUF4190 domain-containing protein [Herbiconiux sp. A18JL235]|uniref:DUF4190 domain-containing protein n=1 Tax=Herbiconiux sp. A18JL235 TaxID=3152363 RepID=A0AB39BHQ0_9MICO